MRASPFILITLLATSALAGCISSDDSDTGNEVMDDPGLSSYTVPETITGFDDLGAVDFSAFAGDEFRLRGNGIWLHDGLMYVSGSAFAILDVENGDEVEVLSLLEDRTGRDVDIMEHPNGGLYAVLAGDPGIVLIDVSDPLNPVEVGTVEIGYHNIAVVPGTAVVYNSRSLYREADVANEGGLVDIVDFSDPEAPEVIGWRMGKSVTTVDGLVKSPSAPACHDIAVYPDVDRAYCAGVTETQVWDITDRKNPVILQIVTNPTTNIHHAAYAARDHNLLIIGDELGGAALAPGCTVPNQPYGGVWFVDISDLSNPEAVGWWAPEEAHEEPVRIDPGAANPAGVATVPTCTAHFGNFVEDRDIMVMGFYTAGVFLVDFSDPSMPTEIANFRPGGDVWEGQYYRGHVYTGDSGRGVDVLKLVGDGEMVYGDEAVDDPDVRDDLAA